MRSDDGTHVTIDVWDYRTDTWTTEKMLGAEFVRRFMLHIVPPGVHRVRYSGCFNAGVRKKRLDEIRALICDYNQDNGFDSPNAIKRAHRLKYPQLAEDEAALAQAKRAPGCLKCGAREMISREHRDRAQTMAYIAKLKYFIGLYALCWTTLDHWMQKDWRERLRARVRAPATFDDWLSRVRFEQAFCVLTTIELRESTLEANTLGCSQSIACSTSLPLPDS